MRILKGKDGQNGRAQSRIFIFGNDYREESMPKLVEFAGLASEFLNGVDADVDRLRYVEDDR